MNKSLSNRKVSLAVHEGIVLPYVLVVGVYYVFHDRVTLFFADNFSMECQIIVKFLHNFF